MKRLLLVIILLELLLVPAALSAQTGASPSAPSLTANHEEKSVEINWDAVAGAVRYQLWIWTVSDSWLQLDEGSLAGTSFNHSGLEAGVEYYYTYRAVFSPENTSEWSDHSSVTIALQLTVPVLTAALDGNAVSLNWDEVSQAAHYQQWAWDRTNNWQLLDDNLSDTTFKHTSVEPGTTYYFTVRPQDSTKRSGSWSDCASVEVPTNITPETATPTPTAAATGTPTPASTATATTTPTAIATATATSDPGSTYLQGITNAAENRCSTYNSDDYSYSQSVEQQIVAGMGGRIYSPYTGEYFDTTGQTDIEHIVARSEAHDSGLCAATMQTRRDFSQDLDNLTLASPAVNRHQKVARDLAEWLPEQNKCWYVNQVVAVKREYNLTMDSAEAQKAVDILTGCTSVALIFLTETSSTATPTATSVAQNNALAIYDDNGNGRITCAEARNHGIAPVPRGHPAYQYMNDRDSDGVVCE